MTADLSELNPAEVGVLICGHGSRNKLAVEEFARLVEGLKPRMGGLPVEHGYLEFAKPILRDSLDRLRDQGVKRVLAVPAMLFAAGHAKNDIPSVLNTYSAETGLKIDYGRELGVDRLMIGAAGARIREALDQAPSEVPLDQTLLVVVGRGSSDPDANSNVAKVTRMLVEGFGFGWGGNRLFGRDFSAGGARASPCGASGLPSHRGVPLLPLFRRAGQPHSPTHRTGGS